MKCEIAGCKDDGKWIASYIIDGDTFATCYCSKHAKEKFVEDTDWTGFLKID